MQRRVILCSGAVAAVVWALAGCGGGPPPIPPPPGDTTYTISGTIALSTGLALENVALSADDGAGQTGSATTGSRGQYTIANLSAATYTVAPALAGYVFTPATRDVTVPVSGTPSGNATSVDFAASTTQAPVLSNATVALSIVGGSPTLTASVTATYSGPGELEVIFRVTGPDTSVIDVLTTTSGADVYSATQALAQLQAGTYSVTIIARDKSDSSIETRLVVSEVLLVPPGPPG